MGCDRIDIPGVGVAIVCTRTRSRACSSCGTQTKGGVLCDEPLAGGKKGKTCSRFVCRGCATHVGPDLDLCPVHARALAIPPSQVPTPSPTRVLLVRTARVSYRGPDRLDVTRKSAGPEGLAFAPSWRILTPVLQRASTVSLDELWPAYEADYIHEMRESYRAYRPKWDALLARETVCLVCYCVGRERCHRGLLAGILTKLGARDEGEVVEPASARLFAEDFS